MDPYADLCPSWSKFRWSSRAALEHPHGRWAACAPPAVPEAALTHPRLTLAQVPARAVGGSIHQNVVRIHANDVTGLAEVVPHPGNVVLPLPDIVAPR